MAADGFAPVVNSEDGWPDDDAPGPSVADIRTRVKNEVLKAWEMYGGLGEYLVMQFGSKKEKLKEVPLSVVPLAL
jgi:hypothetical protein